MPKDFLNLPADPGPAPGAAPGAEPAEAVKPKPSRFHIQGDHRGPGELHAWFRGPHMNGRRPLRRMQRPQDMVEAVLKGWLPDAPWITPQTRITAFGSCFAANISSWLHRRNFRVLNKADEASNAYVVSMGEGMVNSFVIRQQFEWAWENKVFDQPLWHGYSAEDFGYDEAVRQETRRIFDETDLFVLTFGLSEVWFDEPTGNVFWRTVPKRVHDPARHKFRVSTVAENLDNMRAIHDLIRKHRPDARMIFTLSPIPLIATFRDVSCVTANSVSKSVLRVAMDELMRAVPAGEHLFYWPSFELIMDVFRQPFKADNRHVERRCLDFIMTLFEHSWCTGDPEEKPSLTEAWVRACAASGQLPRRLENVVLRRNHGALDRMIARADLDPDPQVARAKSELLAGLRQEWEARGLAPARDAA